MKTLSKILTSAVIAGMGFLNPEKSHSQSLNFYFETYENRVKAWLCNCPKEEEEGVIWFHYTDTDNDKFYDNVKIEKVTYLIQTKESFQYNLETKEVDYKLEFYDFATNEKIIELHPRASAWRIVQIIKLLMKADK